ncbi:MAG TPA: WXG100 family type VII secretion target [Nocardioides sp.]|uniref:WXG100 family type VII secretion target n=1 Tax=Nocardioides sp. TaxID=35761 RepID=UPI002F41E25B
MTIQIEHEAFDRATRLVAEIADGLRREHQQVQAEVADLLAAGWTGVASEQFGEAWHEWCRGMDDILDGIDLQNALLGVVRADLDRTDGARRAAAEALHARLGETG